MVWRPFVAPRFDVAALAPTVAAAPEAELPRGHLPALDAIRGLAILAVTLYRFGGGGDGPARALEPAALVTLGGRGVDLFFVLSGFLITGILADARSRPHFFRNFYARRTLRIFPLYFGALALLLLVLPAVLPRWAADVQPALAVQSWLWLYGANVVQAREGAWGLGPLNHFWSLAIEEHFYLAWPLVIFLVPRRGALWLSGGLVAASLLARLVWLAGGGNDVAAEVLTFLRMDGLALGSWLALFARQPGGWAPLVRYSGPSLVVAGAAACWCDLTGRRLLGAPHLLWSLACACLLVQLVAAPRASWRGRWGQSQVLRFFGQYSYGMYVFQLPLVYLLAPLLTAPGLAAWLGSPAAGQAAYALCLFAVTTLAAVVSWHAYEKHWLTLKSRFGG